MWWYEATKMALKCMCEMLTMFAEHVSHIAFFTQECFACLPSLSLKSLFHLDHTKWQNMCCNLRQNAYHFIYGRLCFETTWNTQLKQIHTARSSMGQFQSSFYIIHTNYSQSFSSDEQMILSHTYRSVLNRRLDAFSVLSPFASLATRFVWWANR